MCVCLALFGCKSCWNLIQTDSNNGRNLTPPVNETERFMEEAWLWLNSVTKARFSLSLQSVFCRWCWTLRLAAPTRWWPAVSREYLLPRMSTGRPAICTTPGYNTHGTKLNTMPTVSSGFVQYKSLWKRESLQVTYIEERRNFFTRSLQKASCYIHKSYLLCHLET